MFAFLAWKLFCNISQQLFSWNSLFMEYRFIYRKRKSTTSSRLPACTWYFRFLSVGLWNQRPTISVKPSYIIPIDFGKTWQKWDDDVKYDVFVCWDQVWLLIESASFSMWKENGEVPKGFAIRYRLDIKIRYKFGAKIKNTCYGYEEHTFALYFGIEGW